MGVNGNLALVNGKIIYAEHLTRVLNSNGNTYPASQEGIESALENVRGGGGEQFARQAVYLPDKVIELNSTIEWDKRVSLVGGGKRDSFLIPQGDFPAIEVTASNEQCFEIRDVVIRRGDADFAILHHGDTHAIRIFNSVIWGMQIEQTAGGYNADCDLVLLKTSIKLGDLDFAEDGGGLYAVQSDFRLNQVTLRKSSHTAHRETHFVSGCYFTRQSGALQLLGMEKGDLFVGNEFLGADEGVTADAIHIEGTDFQMNGNLIHGGVGVHRDKYRNGIQLLSNLDGASLRDNTIRGYDNLPIDLNGYRLTNKAEIRGTYPQVSPEVKYRDTRV